MGRRNETAKDASKRAAVGVGLVTLGALLGGLGLLWWFSGRSDATDARFVAPQERRVSSVGAVTSSVQTVRPVESSPRTPGPVRVPVPTPPPELPSGAPPAEGKAGAVYDPFSRHGEEAPQARALVAVADMQLGVLVGAKVRDEAGLTTLLSRIGGELEKLGDSSGESVSARRQQILQEYQRELGRYMDGEVELRGPGWLMGLEVGKVRAVEEDWSPRPN